MAVKSTFKSRILLDMDAFFAMLEKAIKKIVVDTNIYPEIKEEGFAFALYNKRTGFFGEIIGKVDEERKDDLYQGALLRLANIFSDENSNIMTHPPNREKPEEKWKKTRGAAHIGDDYAVVSGFLNPQVNDAISALILINKDCISSIAIQRGFEDLNYNDFWNAALNEAIKYEGLYFPGNHFISAIMQKIVDDSNH